MLKNLFITGSLVCSVYAFDFGSALNMVSQGMQQTQATSEYEAKGYNNQLSMDMATLADGVFWDDLGKKSFKKLRISYDGFIDKKIGLVNLQFAYGHKGSISKDGMDIYITVRGSKESMDWVTDINFLASKYDSKIDSKLEVHAGFLESANIMIASEKECKVSSKNLKELISLNAQGKRKG